MGWRRTAGPTRSLKMCIETATKNVSDLVDRLGEDVYLTVSETASLLSVTIQHLRRWRIWKRLDMGTQPPSMRSNEIRLYEDTGLGWHYYTINNTQQWPTSNLVIARLVHDLDSIFRSTGQWCIPMRVLVRKLALLSDREIWTSFNGERPTSNSGAGPIRVYGLSSRLKHLITPIKTRVHKWKHEFKHPQASCYTHDQIKKLLEQFPIALSMSELAELGYTREPRYLPMADCDRFVNTMGLYYRLGDIAEWLEHPYPMLRESNKRRQNEIVYCISNPTIKISDYTGLVKIGYTHAKGKRGGLDGRVYNLSKQTPVADDFVKEWAVKVPVRINLEAHLHDVFYSRRHKDDKEYFRVTPVCTAEDMFNKAVEIIEATGVDYSVIVAP